MLERNVYKFRIEVDPVILFPYCPTGTAFFNTSKLKDHQNKILWHEINSSMSWTISTVVYYSKLE